jgi:hypothetical protein
VGPGASLQADKKQRQQRMENVRTLFNQRGPSYRGRALSSGEYNSCLFVTDLHLGAHFFNRCKQCLEITCRDREEARGKPSDLFKGGWKIIG